MLHSFLTQPMPCHKLTEQVAGDAVNRAFGQIHDAISKVLYKSDRDIEPISFYDLITTINEDQVLWNEYCSTLRTNNIVTNLASKEYLFIFIEKNRESIEEQYLILKSAKNNYARSMMKNNKSDYFSSARILCNMILKNCEDEIADTTDEKHSPILNKPVIRKSLYKRRNSVGKKRVF